ncbi:MAG TPA: hypothetical protein VHL58_01870 [Thermoanaerobaculia bacterium]|nr:hypothetical protein [Thermoanaerobaculia bacterium]
MLEHCGTAIRLRAAGGVRANLMETTRRDLKIVIDSLIGTMAGAAGANDSGQETK